MKSLIKTTRKSQWTQIKDLVEFTWTRTANLLPHLVSSFSFKRADAPRPPPPQCDSVLGPSTKHPGLCEGSPSRGVHASFNYFPPLQEVRMVLQIKLIRRVWPRLVGQELLCSSVPGT